MAESALTSFQLLEARLIASMASPIIRALGRSLTWTAEGEEHYDAVIAAGQQPILAIWHGRILLSTYHFRNRNIVVITSQNFDGEWIAGIIRALDSGPPAVRHRGAVPGLWCRCAAISPRGALWGSPLTARAARRASRSLAPPFCRAPPVSPFFLFTSKSTDAGPRKAGIGRACRSPSAAPR